MDFVGHHTIKIPTLLGLSLLITAIALGVFIYIYQLNLKNNQRSLYSPEEITVTNLQSDQATVTWWTETPTISQVTFAEDQNLKDIQKDNRDYTQIKERQVHFVTLRNLKPNTNYYFQVMANGIKYPDKLMSFKTAPPLEETTENKPIRGSVLNTNLNPIDEALVIVQIDNAAEMTTFTSTAGNFIIPLKELRTADMSSVFKIDSPIAAKLIIKKGQIKSQVDLTLPLNESQLLPPLTLGQNINLKDLLSQITPISKQSLPTSYDINSDGVTNSLDLAIITQNNGKKISDLKDETAKKADLNKDEVIDKKDSDLLLSTP